MAGHSQFKNIMYRKGAQDKKRAKQFARLTKEIMVAAKSGLPEPDTNPRLRGAIQTARQANLPKDNNERPIQRAAGGEDATQTGSDAGRDSEGQTLKLTGVGVALKKQ